MIDLYYWTTPNGHKITIALEELALPYSIHPINIGSGDQFAPEFLKISPNNRIPAIVDHEPIGGGEPLAIFESGAILEYLADKTGKLLPREPRPRYQVLQWLYWQMGGLGPMLGQNHHFNHYAPEPIPYAIERYNKEARRLYGVLDDQLAEHEFISGDYSIADIACYPWTVSHERQKITIDEYPHVKRWQKTMAERPAVIAAYTRAEAFKAQQRPMEETRKHLFGQDRIIKN